MMPELKWEWKVGPSTLLSAAQLVAIVIAVIGGFMKMQSDIVATRETLSKLETIVATVKDSQSTQSERVTRVETKMDLIIPSLQRIEANQAMRFQPRVNN